MRSRTAGESVVPHCWARKLAGVKSESINAMPAFVAMLLWESILGLRLRNAGLRELPQVHQDEDQSGLAPLERGHGLADGGTVRIHRISHGHRVARAVGSRQEIAWRNRLRARVTEHPDTARER